MKRPSCQRCLRPTSTCICDLICSIDTDTEVIILQHPLEQKNAKGTARLLHLCLKNSQLIVGEAYTEVELKKLLNEEKQNILLYPADGNASDNSASEDHVSAEATSKQPYNTEQHKPTRLIVIDGTWRKSRKLMYLNPFLQALPRLSLPADSPSQYSIRKAHRPGQLSTLEACCLALSQLESSPQCCDPIINAFHGFMERQITWSNSNQS